MRPVDIVICIPIAVILFFAIRGMAKNVKEGRSIGGCGGDCAHCGMRHMEK